MMKSSNYSWPRGVLYKCKGTHTKLPVQVSQVKSSAKYKTQHSITYKLSQSGYNCQVCCYVYVLAIFGELLTVHTECKNVLLKIGQCHRLECLETHFQYGFSILVCFGQSGPQKKKCKVHYSDKSIKSTLLMPFWQYQLYGADSAHCTVLLIKLSE